MCRFYGVNYESGLGYPKRSIQFFCEFQSVSFSERQAIPSPMDGVKDGNPWSYNSMMKMDVRGQMDIPLDGASRRALSY